MFLSNSLSWSMTIFAAPTVLSRWVNAVGACEPCLFRYDWGIHDERNNATQPIQTTQPRIQSEE